MILSEKIKNYSSSLVKKIFPDYHPTEKESLVCDTVLSTIRDSRTNKIIWEDDFILIAGGECMIKLDGIDLSIISPAGNVCFQSTPTFTDYLRKEISNALSEMIVEVENVFEQKESQTLKAISNSIISK